MCWNVLSWLKYQMCVVFPLRTEDPVAEGQSPLTWTTRTNLMSVTVREKKPLNIMCHHVICVISFWVTCYFKNHLSSRKWRNSFYPWSGLFKTLPLSLHDELSGNLYMPAPKIEESSHFLSSFSDSPLSFCSKSSPLQHEERVCC